MSTASEDTIKAAKLAGRAKKLFAGQGSVVTGAALAELVALHLAGHIVPDDPEETKEIRDGLLKAFIYTVEKLTPVLEQMEILPRLAEMQQRKRPN
jgi:hypothetical protein